MKTNTSEQQKTLPPYFKKGVFFVIFTICAVILAWNIIVKTRDLLLLILVSFFISLIIEPIVKKLETKGIKRGISTAGTIIALIIIIGFIAYEFGNLFVNQFIQIINNIPNYFNDLNSWLFSHFQIRISTQNSSIQNFITEKGFGAATNIFSIGTNFFVGFIFALGSIILVFYLTAQGPEFRKTICSPLPEKQQKIVLEIWKIAQEKTANFILSRLIIAIINSILLLIFLLILHIPYAFALCLFTGLVSQFIPTIGTYIGGALPALVALSVKPLDALLIIIYIIIYQQFENYFVQPKIASEMLEINPAIAFISVIAFAMLMGPVGAFFALPITATIQAVVSTYIKRYDLIKSDLL
jgi:predicted PurR-regulated permease PerM